MDIKGGLIPLKKLFSGDWKVRLIVALGLLGMLLILLSQCMRPSAGQKPEREPEGLLSSEEYTQTLEKKLQSMIESIEGVGKARVMITLESSEQMVYATEQKTQTESMQDITGEDKKRTQQSDNRQTSYILIDKGSGQKQPVVTARLEPQVKGVVVVCPGAENKVVGARVVEVVTTALGIGSNRVCVVKGGT